MAGMPRHGHPTLSSAQDSAELQYQRKRCKCVVWFMGYRPPQATNQANNTGEQVCVSRDSRVLFASLRVFSLSVC